MKTIKWTIAETPNVFIRKVKPGKRVLLQAKIIINARSFMVVPWSLKALYPDRDTFILNEVISFYKCAILFFTAIWLILEQARKFDTI